MSTRATIRIKDGRRKICVYHHHDGYPEGLGMELKKYLGTLGDNKWAWNGYRIATELIKGIKFVEPSLILGDTDTEFQLTEGQHGDEEYAYLIDCKKRSLTCYKVGWDDRDWTDDKIVPIP